MTPNGQIGDSDVSKWLRIISQNLEQLNRVASSKKSGSTTITTTTTTM
jgi:hypothetical protein